jgi:hypothetical protein
MSVSELVSALFYTYEEEIKHILLTQDKYPSFTLE